MTTRIGLISDVHASPAPLAQALEIFAAEAVDDIVCAGDIAGYHDGLKATVELLAMSGCKSIAGNHDQKYLDGPYREDEREMREYLEALPLTLELAIEGRKLLVVHANPPRETHGGIKLLDQQGQVIEQRRERWRRELSGLGAEVLIVGHTHQVYAEQLGDVFVVNPGSSAFNHSCMILSLPDLKVSLHALQNRDIVYCWNFGMLRG